MKGYLDTSSTAELMAMHIHTYLPSSAFNSVYSSGAARLVYMCTVVYTRAAIMPCRPSRH
jgi:hypothetical protein